MADMDILDQILENLELERDLGTRTVEIDRALLVPPSAEPETPLATPKPVSASQPQSNVADHVPQKTVSASAIPPPPVARQNSVPASSMHPPALPAQPVAPQCNVDIAFFTGRELSAKGLEAMEKIFGAIKKIKPNVSICMNEETKARVCVLLGAEALRKYLPTARPLRGAWVSVQGMPAIMTFSPDYIFSHFQEGSPNMNKAKTEMWNDIKLAVARL